MRTEIPLRMVNISRQMAYETNSNILENKSDDQNIAKAVQLN